MTVTSYPSIDSRSQHEIAARGKRLRMTNAQGLWLCVWCVFGVVLAGCSDNVSQLSRKLQQGKGDERYEAAKQLETQIEQGEDAAAAVPALARALSDDDPKVRYRAAKSLAKLDDAAAPAIESLAQALADQENEDRMRYYVAKSIYKLGDRRVEAIHQLIGALHDKHADVRCYAAKALGKIGQPAETAMPALRKLSQSGEAQLREAATSAIEKIKEQDD